MKVLHLFGNAVLARANYQWCSSEFLKHGIKIDHEPVSFHPVMRKGLSKNVDEWVEYVNEHNYEWVFFGWEMFDGFEAFWNHPKRKSKVLIYLQEQPQRLFEVKKLRQFSDILITSSPVFQEDTNGYIPFPVHTPFFKDHVVSWEDKQNRILISGSHRQCRYEVFKQLLETQPFRWPVVFMPSGNEPNLKRRAEYKSLVDNHPLYITSSPRDHGEYIPSLLNCLNASKVFVDFTFNPYPYLLQSGQCEASLADVTSVIPIYKGGYMPERVLDACYLGNACFTLTNPAIEFCLGEDVIQYSNYDELIEKVNIALEDEEELSCRADALRLTSQAFTAEKIVEQIAAIFWTGRHVNQYVSQEILNV